MIGPKNPIPLGAFELRHPIGRGAMGEVWAGTHRAHGVPVAVKILTGAVAERAGYALSFRQEVRAVAGLDHPNIVTVYDFGHIPEETAKLSGNRYPAGRPYLVMELVEGGSLAARRGNLEWPELYAILVALLDALGHAHARDLIHRDLKPHNVMLPLGPDEPAIKLTDFGLAHALDRHADDPWREHLAGTPNYMAPEQIECRWRDYGPWTDLYAFGCLAWSLLTGLAPFAARDPREVLRHQVRRPPPKLSMDLLARKGVPPGFETWLLRLLEKDPARRYQRAADAAWALLNLVDGKAPLTATEAAPTQWQLPVVGADDSAPSEESILFGSARALTWTVEDLSSLGDSADDPGDPDAPPLPASWRGPGPMRWQPLAGAGLGLFGLRAVPLVDRSAERDRLWRALRRVHRDGLPRAVVLRGAPGFGKSSLAQWLCQRAHEVGAATVLKATHSPTPTPRDGLAPMLGRFHGCDELPRSTIVDRMVRVIDDLAPDAPGRVTEVAHQLGAFIVSGRGDDFGARMSREQKYMVLAEHLRRLGRHRPVILWIDDAQWSDESVEFGRRLLERADDVRALLVYTVRADRPEALPLSVAQLEMNSGTERMTVGAVPEDDMPELVQALLGLEGEVAARVQARAEGNPLFAVQLVSDWVQRGLLVPGELGFDLRPDAEVGIPDSVHALWGQRLEEAVPDPQDRMAVEIAALLGPTVEQDIWEAALEAAGLEATTDTLSRLVDRGLVRRDGSHDKPVWVFVHGMLRESLERGAEEAGRLPTLHLYCERGVAIRRRGRGYALRRAQHFMAGGKPREALFPLISAGHDALAEDDHAGAEMRLQAFTRVAAEVHLPPADKLRSRARQLSCRIALSTGDFDRVDMLARAMLQEAQLYNWPRAEGRAHIDLAWAANRRGHWKGAIARTRRAEEHARKIDDKNLLITCLRNQAQLLLDRGEFAEIMGKLDEALEELKKKPFTTQQALCQISRARCCMRFGEFDTAEAALQQAWDLFDAEDVRWGLAQVLTARGKLALARGDVDGALAVLSDALTRYEYMEDVNAPWARLTHGQALLAKGDLDAAEASFADELQLNADKDRHAVGLVAELGLLQVAGERAEWRMWRDMLSRIDTRLTIRQSATRDAIAMLEAAGHAAARNGGDAQPVWALAMRLWGALDAADEVARIGALQAAGG